MAVEPWPHIMYLEGKVCAYLVEADAATQGRVFKPLGVDLGVR